MRLRWPFTRRRAKPGAPPTPAAEHKPAALLGALAQSPLAARWRGLQRQFDQRSQRERLLLIGAATAAAMMLGDTLWLGPALGQFRTAEARHKTAERDLASLQAESRTRQDVGSQQARQQQAELAMWRQRVRDGEARLLAHEDTLVGPDRMVGLLEQLLARNAAVRVRAMRSLGRSDLLGGNPADPARPANNAPQAANPPTNPPTNPPAADLAGTGNTPANPTLYRHGVELVLEGSFVDLLQYLRAVEELPQRVLWGGVSLKVEQHPRCVLTLRAYTISRDRHWLEI